MQITQHDREVVTELLKTREDTLIEFVLKYAERQDYTRYTSTLKEAWRLSIEGLSEALLKIVTKSTTVPEITPDEDFSSDPAAQYGMLEARRHRARGVNLVMFLGLMKYYRQAYLDLAQEVTGFNQPAAIHLLIIRFFDRIELAFCNEWAGTDSEEQIKELSDSNLHLANEKNKYLTLFESLSSPVFLCDQNGKIDNYNNVAGRLLPGSHTSGDRYYAEQRDDLEVPGLQEELAVMMADKMEYQVVEKTYQTSDGTRTYDVLIKRMLDVSHKFSGYTILFNDITERLNWARQLQEVNGKQQELIDDLNQTRQQLVQSEKLAAIGQLASGVAHEINTPVQYIADNIGFFNETFEDLFALAKDQQRLLSAVEHNEVSAELVADVRAVTDDAELDYILTEVPRAMRQTKEGVDGISTIVSGMKEFARPGVKGKVETDINNAIRSVVNVSANQWKYYAKIETDLDSELPFVPVVPGELNQALLNIIVNAATAVTDKAGGVEPLEKGTISIKTQCNGNWVEIDISDTGPGIPDEIKSKIFDPFFTTRDVGKGSGQGLTVAYLAIVEKHAGRIDVRSSPGEGTTFKVRLPLTPGTNKSAARELWRQARSGIA